MKCEDKNKYTFNNRIAQEELWSVDGKEGGEES